MQKAKIPEKLQGLPCLEACLKVSPKGEVMLKRTQRFKHPEIRDFQPSTTRAFDAIKFDAINRLKNLGKYR